MKGYSTIRAVFLHNQLAITIVLVIFYTVGVIGMLLPTTNHYFFQLTPLALLLSFIVLALADQSSNRGRLIAYLGFIYVSSYIVEVVGVSSGVVFGEYVYGDNLGIKLWGTPLLIGANWFFLVYVTAAIFDKTNIFTPFKVLFGASLMLMYDVIMEQVAPTLDMWSWKQVAVPFQNYFTWFAMAITYHIGLKLLKIKVNNGLALSVFMCQFLFFVILYIYLS